MSIEAFLDQLEKSAALNWGAVGPHLQKNPGLAQSIGSRSSQLAQERFPAGETWARGTKGYVDPKTKAWVPGQLSPEARAAKATMSPTTWAYEAGRAIRANPLAASPSEKEIATNPMSGLGLMGARLRDEARVTGGEQMAAAEAAINRKLEGLGIDPNRDIGEQAAEKATAAIPDILGGLTKKVTGFFGDHGPLLAAGGSILGALLLFMMMRGRGQAAPPAQPQVVYMQGPPPQGVAPVQMPGSYM